MTVSTAVVCNHLEQSNPTFQHAIPDGTRLSLKMNMKFSFILHCSTIQSIRNQSARALKVEREHFAVSVSSVTNVQKKMNIRVIQDKSKQWSKGCVSPVTGKR